MNEHFSFEWFYVLGLIYLNRSKKISNYRSCKRTRVCKTLSLPLLASTFTTRAIAGKFTAKGSFEKGLNLKSVQLIWGQLNDSELEAVVSNTKLSYQIYSCQAGIKLAKISVENLMTPKRIFSQLFLFVKFMSILLWVQIEYIIKLVPYSCSVPFRSFRRLFHFLKFAFTATFIFSATSGPCKIVRGVFSLVVPLFSKIAFRFILN